ncbi:MAG: hypothetical protein ABEI31_05630 [Halodesulfurarchaeum sp.]
MDEDPGAAQLSVVVAVGEGVETGRSGRGEIRKGEREEREREG